MKIFITREIPDAGIKALKEASYRVERYKEDQVISRKELLKRVKGCDAILSLLTDTIDGEVMEAAGPQLKIVANYAVGFDNIDLNAAKSRGVVVTNTVGPELTETVADHTIALMMALAHRVVEADGFTRAKKYKGWSPTLLLGTDFYGKTIGVIGTGRIGQAVAERAVKGFKMKCIYADQRRNPTLEKECRATMLPIDQVLENADFISLHVPLLESTRHLISTEQFALMKKTAFLVNTARGPVVDEKALLRALKTKRIAGAGLDVFENEPEIDADLTDKLELKQFSNVILTPHIASATIEARQAMSKLAAENIIAVLSGKPALTPAK